GKAEAWIGMMSENPKAVKYALAEKDITLTQDRVAFTTVDGRESAKTLGLRTATITDNFTREKLGEVPGAWFSDAGPDRDQLLASYDQGGKERSEARDKINSMLDKRGLTLIPVPGTEKVFLAEISRFYTF